MAHKKNPDELPADALIDYDKEGVPISRNMDNEAAAEQQPQDDGLVSNRNRQESKTPQDSGFTGGAHNKKKQGTEDAQKRSDTGTGL